MANRTVSKCPTCGFPINADFEGQTKVCAYCGAKLEAVVSQGVTIPTPLFVGVVAFLIGVVVGPALIASTEGGSRWLAEQARARIQ